MISKLELKVREMDDGTKSITENARAIADKLNEKSWKYILTILTAKRQGFDSIKNYRIKNFKKRGFNRLLDLENAQARKRNFKDFYEYQDYIAQRNSFLDYNEYTNYLYHKSRGKFKNQKDFQEREGLLEGLEYIDPEKLDAVISWEDYSFIGILETEDKKEEMRNNLDQILKRLPEKYRLIIKSRFYEGKTLEEIGKEVDKTRARAGQLEVSALKKLSYLAKQSGLYALYIEQ